VNREFLLDALKMSVRTGDYGFDLDGNGKADNRLGAVFSALMSQGLDLQFAVDQAVSAGKVGVLFTLITPQADVMVDQTADLRVVRALATGQADPSAVPLTLKGQLKAGRFTSAAPTVGSVLFTWELELPLGPGLPARLAVQWLRIGFTIDPNGTRLLGGSLNGSVSSSTVNNELIPSLASILTLYIVTSPDSETSRIVKALFDTGGCNNPDGTPAVKGDGRISPCELSQNPLIKTLFTPDVQLRNAGGTYQPVPGGAQPDSLSIGFGFTAKNLVLA
jgi:hypothetical protein